MRSWPITATANHTTIDCHHTVGLNRFRTPEHRDRVGAQRQCGENDEEVKHALAVEPGRPLGQCAHQVSRNSMVDDPFGAVHPGKRGNDDPRRIAVIQREVGAVDLQRQQRRRVKIWLVCRTA